MGEKSKSLLNVLAVYFMLHGINCLILTINRYNKPYPKPTETLTVIEEIERSDSRIAAYRKKDIGPHGTKLL